MIMELNSQIYRILEVEKASGVIWIAPSFDRQLHFIGKMAEDGLPAWV